MPYSDIYGKRPFERASKTVHTEVIKNPLVQAFLGQCTLPSAPIEGVVPELALPVPEPRQRRIRTVVAIDGGVTQTYVRERFPTASIIFMSVGSLLFNLEDLAELDSQPFIGPEDMARLKNLQRYTLVLPAQAVRLQGCGTFREGVRKTVQEFLLQRDGHLMAALRWLLFHEWLDANERQAWTIPRCPNPHCMHGAITFRHDDPPEKACSECGKAVYLADALRLYERVDEELGATGIAAYLLAAVEQLILVHLISSVWQMKRDLLRDILFVRDGPLAFFGVTAPLHKPMRDLMKFLACGQGGPAINLAGIEKSGPFVDHAMLIENDLEPGSVLLMTNDYIYRYVEPGDSDLESFGKNTYYGSKAIFKSLNGDTYVVTLPTGAWKSNPALDDLYNAAEVLSVVGELRCSMYDNALVPIALANRLVSLADVPSSQILAKFARDRLRV